MWLASIAWYLWVLYNWEYWFWALVFFFFSNYQKQRAHSCCWCGCRKLLAGNGEAVCGWRGLSWWAAPTPLSSPVGQLWGCGDMKESNWSSFFKFIVLSFLCVKVELTQRCMVSGVQHVIWPVCTLQRAHSKYGCRRSPDTITVPSAALPLLYLPLPFTHLAHPPASGHYQFALCIYSSVSTIFPPAGFYFVWSFF